MDLNKLKDNIILIVDDQPRNLDVLIGSLEQYGFDFLVAQNGVDALKRVTQIKPDIILLDILMPGMDGFEVCEKLKSDTEYADIPLIFMSALTDTVDKIKGFELGAVDYITKPFQIDEIIARIYTHLTIGSLRDELKRNNLKLEEKVKQRTADLEATNEKLTREIIQRKESEIRFKKLVETLHEGVWAFDESGICNYTNPRLLSMLGKDSTEILGKHFSSFFSGTNLDLVSSLFETHAKISAVEIEAEIQEVGEELIIVNLGINALFDELNNFQGVLMAVANVTHRKIAEQALIEKDKQLEWRNNELITANKQMKDINSALATAKEQAEESDRLKSSFLSNLSHEIRTPMNAIVGFSDLLQQDDFEPENKTQYIQMIVTSTLQLLAVITDIIEVSKLSAKKVDVHLTQFEFSELFDELEEILHKEVQLNNKNHFEIEILRHNQPIILVSDTNKIRVSITKLISNAVKFTQSGKISLGYESIAKDKLRIFVRDTGIGVPKNAQSLIFERFRQAEENEQRRYGGIGLGLTIARELIELIGGKIGLFSEEGKGSEFFIELECESAPRELHVETKLIATIHDIVPGKTVLVAEDEDINLIYLRELLFSCDLNVLEASNGLEAVRQFELHPDISLVLLDLKMPILNGFDALKRIKAINNKIPIIAQTAYAMSEDEEKSREAGFDDYISKPIDRKQLVRIISKYLHD